MSKINERDIVDTKKLNWINRVIFLTFLVVLLLTYSSVLMMPYGFNDDYRLLAITKFESYQRVIEIFIGQGRPISGFLISFFLSLCQSIEELRYLRLLAVFDIFLLACCLYKAGISVKWPVEQAAFLAVIVSTLVSFQVFAGWAVCFPYPLAGVSAFLAVVSAQNIFKTSRLLRQIALIILSAFLIAVSLTIYQPTAMFFWVFVAISLFGATSTPKDTIRHLLGYMGIATIGFSLGFLIFKIGTNLYPQGVRSGLTHDLTGKISWFVTDRLMNALILNKFPYTFGNNILSLIIGIFIITGLIMYFRGNWKERLLMLGMAISLIPLTFLPNLVTADNSSNYRTLSALNSLIVIYIFLGLHGYCKTLGSSSLIRISLLKLRFFAAQSTQNKKLWIDRYLVSTLLGLAALTSCLNATYNINKYFTWPNMLEIKLMQSQLQGHDFNTIKTIYVRQAYWSNFAGRHIYDELGVPSSGLPWLPEPMVQLLLHNQLSSDYQEISIKVIPAEDNLIVTKVSSDELVVDMKQLDSFQ